MPIVPLYGHPQLRERLLGALQSGRLPASLLLHGPAGVGKQRLALWLASAILCESADRPCGACQSCRYCAELAHPDLHWIFPRPRLKDADASHEDVRQDYAEAIAERVAANGLYARPSGSEGIFVVAVRSIVHRAGISPAIGRRKVFVVGDGERMVPQEGSEMAANAFLKLLEEPPTDTTIIVTSSEPGALLPTIRSRVVSLRVGSLPEADMRRFLADPFVVKALESESLPHDVDARLAVAAGAPGALFGGTERDAARKNARAILDAAEAGDRVAALRIAFAQGASGARGRFTETLDALAVIIHDRVRTRVARGDERAAERSARAIDAVERARLLASGNVSPNLVTAELFRTLAER
ncbi:MAG: ATP-binding protein [Gemmatimonadaceae bacterium]